MSFLSDDVTTRRALLSDYEAVMALGSMYDGRDYLWAIYRELVQDPKTYPVVAEANGLVVGFYLTSVFDGGLAVMKRAARVHEDFRGRGVFHKMEAELDRHTASRRPRVQYDTFANTDTVDHLAGRFLEKGFEMVYRKAVTNMLICSGSVPPPQTTDRHSPANQIIVGELGRQHLKLLFHNERLEPKVFPQGRLFNFYLSYGLVDDNIRHLLCERGGAFASSLESPTGSDTAQRPETADGHISRGDLHISSPPELDLESINRVAMVTFYYCFPTPTAFLYFLDAYARPEVSRDHFLAHMRRNLEALQRHFPEQAGVLCMTFDSQIQRDVVTSCLTELGIVEEMLGQENFQVLYERRRN